MDLIAVLLGSTFGGMARFALSGFVARRIGETFPWGTLAVNVSGALAIGLVAAAAAGGVGLFGPRAWHFAVFGFLGSYTTVSSFSLQTLTLTLEGEWRQATANVALSLGLCLSAAGLGYFTGGWLAGSA
jgi:fluoride exporter